MKKHLIAVAVAAAVSAPAMAQNVTLFGTLDGGVASFQNVNGNNDDFTGFVDGGVTSSVWGIRGSEDLGGGLRAVFEAIGDVQLNNGAQHQTGIFRRAAYAGVAGAFGEVTFGVRTNPLIATNGALTPLGGNSFNTLVATGLGYADFFTRNAVTYTSPNLSGLVIQAQYGLANTAQQDTNAGRMFAGSVVYTAGPLAFRAAMQDRKVGTAGTAQANASASGKSSNVMGLTYTSGPLVIAAAVAQNEIDGATFAGTLAQGGAALNPNRQYRMTMIGGSYQLTPAWRLGLNYASGEGSSLTNLQGRYSLSKRTTAYVQYNSADNGATIGIPVLGGNTGTENVGMYSDRSTVSISAFAPLNTKATAIGAGLIHSF